jgi:hypothetical protein
MISELSLGLILFLTMSVRMDGYMNIQQVIEHTGPILCFRFICLYFMWLNFDLFIFLNRIQNVEEVFETKTSCCCK